MEYIFCGTVEPDMVNSELVIDCLMLIISLNIIIFNDGKFSINDSYAAKFI